MAVKKPGARTAVLSNPPVVLCGANAAGRMEGEGPLSACLDYVDGDDAFGESTWERSERAMQQKAREDRRATPQPIVKKKGGGPSAILEVDLHINELLDNTNGLSNADMLNYQLSKFHEVMAQYAHDKGQKIVFIHGKGDGVLRKAIEKELNTKYKQHYYQDASFREYGFGATMVTIK